MGTAGSWSWRSPGLHGQGTGTSLHSGPPGGSSEPSDHSKAGDQDKVLIPLPWDLHHPCPASLMFLSHLCPVSLVILTWPCPASLVFSRRGTLCLPHCWQLSTPRQHCWLHEHFQPQPRCPLGLPVGFAPSHLLSSQCGHPGCGCWLVTAPAWGTAPWPWGGCRGQGVVQLGSGCPLCLSGRRGAAAPGPAAPPCASKRCSWLCSAAQLCHSSVQMLNPWIKWRRSVHQHVGSWEQDCPRLTGCSGFLCP